MLEEDTLDSWSVLEELAGEFEEEHGVRVKLLPLGGASGAQDKGRFFLAGDLPLDVLRIDVTELAAFRAEGALLDLQPYFDADDAWNPAAYFAPALAACRDAEGHLNGLPSTFTPYVMYVNLDLVRAAGLEVPRADWRWTDFVRAARATTRDTDEDGRTDEFGISLTQWSQAVAPWIWQAGGAWLDEKAERSRMAEPVFVEVMQFLHDLLHVERVGSFDASFQNQLTQGLFQAGRAAFYGPVGYWETYRFQHITEFAWDVLPLPRGRQAATAVAMTVYVVPRTARHPELAYEFVRVVAGERYQRTLAEIGNGVPGLESVARSPSFLKPDVLPASEHVFLDVMEHARFLPTAANWRKIESLVQAELETILFEEDCDVAAACGRMAEATDRYLELERRRQTRPRFASAGAGVGELAVAFALLALAAFVLVTRRSGRSARLLLLPWALGFIAFLLGPAFVSLVLAFCEWSPLRPLDDARWVGFENFARLGADRTFQTSLGATLAYVVVAVPLGTALALALAWLLRRTTTWNALLRTLCYLPAVAAPVVVGTLWRSLLDADTGLVNRALRVVGIEGPAWLTDSDWVVPAFVGVSLWAIGTQMLVFLAALLALDPALDDAAKIDGARGWQRFRHVVLPQLSPVVLFNLVTGAVAALQIFAQPYVMTQGGPGDASRFLVLYVYETAFRHLDMGYASVLAWVLVALATVFVALFLVSSKRWVHYAGRRG